MALVKNIVHVSGQIQSWEEGTEIFTLKRNSLGKPESVSSRVGRWGRQECVFLYSPSGEFIGTSTILDSSLLPVLLEEAAGVVRSNVNSLTGEIEIGENLLVIGQNAPSNSDGRPDGTIYIQKG